MVASDIVQVRFLVPKGPNQTICHCLLNGQFGLLWENTLQL